MPSRVVPLLVLLALLIPAAAADAESHVDLVIDFTDPAAPALGGHAAGWELQEAEAGERYVWDLALTDNFTIVDLRLRDAFDVERPRQVVPTLLEPGVDYPLFERFPNEQLWTADAPVRVYRYLEAPEGDVLRLGIPGPTNATLVLTRDVTPPTFTLGPVENLTWRSFYQETTTDELALADLQVRAQGSEEWVQNPTPVHHVRQRFPIQGLDGGTTYEARVVFTDWAGNEATSETYTLTTPPEPERPEPVVTPVSPAPNATVEADKPVVVRATVASPDSPVRADGVRVFFDKRELHDGFTFDGTEVRFSTALLEPGRHVVAVEAMNEAGGRSYAQWAFEVPGETRESPAGAAWTALLAFAAVAVALRARR